MENLLEKAKYMLIFAAKDVLGRTALVTPQHHFLCSNALRLMEVCRLAAGYPGMHMLLTSCFNGKPSVIVSRSPVNEFL